MWHVTTLAVLDGAALAWFILFLIGLAVLLWFISWLFFPVDRPETMGKSLKGLTGLDPALASRLAPFGIHSDRDLVRLPPRGQQELESQLGLHNGEYDRWKREILARWRDQYLPAEFREIADISPDVELGGLYTKRPRESDDLTKLHGVDKTTANRLNNAGIYTFEQFRLMTPEQRACAKRRFNLNSFDFDTVPDFGVTAKWLAFSGDRPAPSSTDRTREVEPDAVSGNEEIIATSFTSREALKSGAERMESLPANSDSGIPRSRIDAELGRVYTSAPPHRDDLTAIAGIDDVAAAKLNAAGIYTTDQIRSLSAAQRASFKRRFDLPGFDFSQWVPKAVGGGSGVVPKPHFELTADADSSNVQDEAAHDVAKPGQPRNDSGYASSSNGSNAVAGFAAGHAGSLESLDRTAPGSEASPLGFTYASRPDDADELERLPHIDADTAKRLNRAGIYKFDQLNSMTLSQQTQLRTQFGLEPANFADWQRLIYAWSHGVSTSRDAEVRSKLEDGWLHSVRLPVVVPGVFDGQRLVAYPEQVVFRGSNPQHWGTTVSQPRDDVTRSVAAKDTRTDINYVRIRRMDTRESVVTQITKAQLYLPGSNDQAGWNGLCEQYFGARHLGVYASQIPMEVEAKYGMGGWGFGHQVDVNDGQECCWAGRIIPPTTFEISVGRIGAPVGTVLFRSSDPTIWNQRMHASLNHMATPIESVSHPVSFVRIMRTDTGQAVIVAVKQANLTRLSEHPRLGWNGLNEHFYGGHHLGVYLQTATQDVEIAFGKGGWGFGHFYEQNDRQAYGWGGHALAETVFEISVLEDVPEHLRHELLEA